MTQLLHIGTDPFSKEYVFLESDYDFVALIDQKLGRQAADFTAELIESREEALRDKAEAEADAERAGDAYQSGWDDGYNNGYQDGHDDGYEEGYGFATSHQNNEQGESHE